MPVDVNRIFDRGGRELIDLLEFCVLSVQMDPLFVFLVGEYRSAPTADKAQTLYELFCAVGAPARISPHHLLPPKDFRLPQTLAPFFQTRQLLNAAAQKTATEPDEEPAAEAEAEPAAPGDGEPRPQVQGLMLLPPRYLFDSLRDELLTQQPSPITRLGKQFDPLLTPRENLPGGALTAAQKFFVNYVWTPRLRPQLVTSGFRRVANVA